MGSSKLLLLSLCLASADANLRGEAQVNGDANFTDMFFETIDANLTRCGETFLDFTEEDACHDKNDDLIDATAMCESTCKELSFRLLGACAANSSFIELPEALPVSCAELLTRTSLHALHVLLGRAKSALANCTLAQSPTESSLSPPVASFSKAQVIIGLRGNTWQQDRDERLNLGRACNQADSARKIVIGPGLRGRRRRSQPRRRRTQPHHDSQNLHAFSRSQIVIGLRRSHGENWTLVIQNSSMAAQLAKSQLLLGIH
mmetsp:Transcript_98172/g.174773  ORF Transcript_98172/g.174773 Transcript_98172/m.174773 type:complete len:260 (+) Transcript_98172:71-850(+)